MARAYWSMRSDTNVATLLLNSEDVTGVFIELNTREPNSREGNPPALNIFSLLIHFKAKLKYVCFPQRYLEKNRKDSSSIKKYKLNINPSLHYFESISVRGNCSRFRCKTLFTTSVISFSEWHVVKVWKRHNQQTAERQWAVTPVFSLCCCIQNQHSAWMR